MLLFFAILPFTLNIDAFFTADTADNALRARQVPVLRGDKEQASFPIEQEAGEDGGGGNKTKREQKLTTNGQSTSSPSFHDIFAST